MLVGHPVRQTPLRSEGKRCHPSTQLHFPTAAACLTIQCELAKAVDACASGNIMVVQMYTESKGANVDLLRAVIVRHWVD